MGKPEILRNITCHYNRLQQECVQNDRELFEHHTSELQFWKNWLAEYTQMVEDDMVKKSKTIVNILNGAAPNASVKHDLDTMVIRTPRPTSESLTRAENYARKHCYKLELEESIATNDGCIECYRLREAY